LWQAGHAALPFVGGAARGRPLAEVDSACDALLTNHVANRASRAQGRALLSTSVRVFEGAVAAVAEQSRGTCTHYAPVFGALTAALGVAAGDAQALFLHASLRGTLSAAVRLGIVGPLEAQRMHAARAPLLDRVASACGSIAVEDASSATPLLDAFAALHDRLYARLFQS
jgi:urease accessory protein